MIPQYCIRSTESEYSFVLYFVYMTFFNTDSLCIIVGYKRTIVPSLLIFIPAIAARSDRPLLVDDGNFDLSVSGKITAVDLNDSGNIKLIMIAKIVTTAVTLPINFLECQRSERIFIQSKLDVFSSESDVSSSKRFDFMIST